jgi:vesicle-associated membrane protein 7
MILYALVARGKVVLAEHTNASGNFPTITRVLLSKITDAAGKMSYVYDQHVFHYIVENGLTYLCMCDDLNKRRVPFQFLEDVKDTFVKTYAQKAQTAIAFSLNDEFGPVLAQKLEFYQSSKADNFSAINEKLDDVKNVMVQNIDLVLERGEKLELLVDKTEALSNEAFNFKSRARHLKNEMWWKKVKTYTLLFFALLLVIFVIVWIACGIDFGKCKSTKAPASS